MTYTVALCNVKGGTGKTTSTIMLASALHDAGYSVLVLDADPQGSATTWADLASDANPLGFTVEAANMRILARKRTEDFVLIDCPPGAGNIIAAAIDQADLVVIPTCPSAIEVDRMWDTVELVASTGKQYKVLLTSVQLGTTTLAQIQEALDSSATPKLRTVIPQRMDIKRMWGKKPEKYHGYKQVAETLIEETHA